VTSEGWAAEPSVVVSAVGTVIVTAADVAYSPVQGTVPAFGAVDLGPLTPGVPSRLWIQGDGGFREVPPVAGSDVTNLPTGNEGHVATSVDGVFYFVDMTRASTSLVRSDDDGKSWQLVNPAVFRELGGDRPWVAAGPDGLVAVTWNRGPSSDTQQQVVAVSTDYGVTFPTQTTLDSGWSFVGTIAIDHEGSVYVVKEQPEGLSLFTSRDAGVTFQKSLIHETSKRVGYSFPSITVDGSGGLHVAWAEETAETVGIWYAQGTHKGTAWTLPALVADPGSTNAMPWISANDDLVAIGYYTSLNASGPPELASGDWYPAASAWNRTENGTWLQWMGTTPVHRGAVCTNGSTCDNVDRSLADLLGIAVASDRVIHLVWTEEALRFRASKVQYAELGISNESLDVRGPSPEVQEVAMQALVVGDSSANARHGAIAWGQLHPPIGTNAVSVDLAAPGVATMRLCVGPCQRDGAVVAEGDLDGRGTLSAQLVNERFLWWLVEVSEATPEGRVSASATYDSG